MSRYSRLKQRVYDALDLLLNAGRYRQAYEVATRWHNWAVQNLS